MESERIQERWRERERVVVSSREKRGHRTEAATWHYSCIYHLYTKLVAFFFVFIGLPHFIQLINLF